MLLPLKEYNAMQRSLENLRNTQLMKDIRDASLQIAAGNLIEVTDIDAL